MMTFHEGPPIPFFFLFFSFLCSSWVLFRIEKHPGPCLMSCSILHRLMRTLWVVCMKPTWPVFNSSWAVPAPARDNPMALCTLRYMTVLLDSRLCFGIGSSGKQGNESLFCAGLNGADGLCHVPLSTWSHDGHFTTFSIGHQTISLCGNKLACLINTKQGLHVLCELFSVQAFRTHSEFCF